jgi:hypothetical protein
MLPLADSSGGFTEEDLAHGGRRSLLLNLGGGFAKWVLVCRQGEGTFRCVASSSLQTDIATPLRLSI